MLERLCKELGLKYDGRWEDVGGYQFTIINPKLISNGASFTVFTTDRLTLINAMNAIESKWINFAIKNKNEEPKIEEDESAMCKNTFCRYAFVHDDSVVNWCSFYEKGRNSIPNRCQIPFLCDEDAIELTEEA